MMTHHQRWTLLLCLQAWLVAAGSDADSFEMTGIFGESVTFPLNIQNAQEVKTIAWTSESSVAVITPGDSGRAAHVIVTHNNYNGRLKVIDKNYNLVISELKMEDAGKYRADITTTTGTTTTKFYYLHVYRRLGKPTITKSIILFANGTCNVTLTCSVNKDEKNVTYRWSSLKTESNVLQLIQTPENQGLNYTCTTRNPISNSSSTISSHQLCADIVTGFKRHYTGFLSGLVITFLAILILPAVLLFYLRKRRKDVSSESTVYASVKISRDTPPEEPKTYHEIAQPEESPSKKESVQTVYSTVQCSHEMKKTNAPDGTLPKTPGYKTVI